MVTLGQHILGYTLQEVIGEGGMATIYRATNPLGKQKAIKVLKPEFTSDPHVRQRFEQEAQIMVKLGEHTVHICQVDDLEITPRYVALIMEYLQGENLATYLRKNGPISPRRLITWMEPVLLAVGYAHKQNVVHRDIKPANLYLTTQGQIKVLDFGIAKVLSSTEDLTFTQQMIGSPRYMSPEQILTPKQVDHRSDIYSLGVTMWTLLTGHRPFTGESGNESDFMIQTRIVNQLLPPLEGQLALLDPVIQQATAKAVDDRYQNCQLLSEALVKALKTSGQPAALSSGSDEERTQILKPSTVPPATSSSVQLLDSKAEVPKSPVPSPPPTVEFPLEPALSSPPPTIEFPIEPVSKATRGGLKKTIIYAFLALTTILAAGYFWGSNQALWSGDRAVVPFTKKGRYGVRDAASGEVLLPAEFFWVDSLRDNVMVVEVRPDTYRILGKDGKWRSDKIDQPLIIYDKPFNEELAILVDSVKGGYIDKTGKTIIDLQFDDAYPFSEGLAAVQKNGKWGYIDKKGQLIIDFQFTRASSFINGFACVEKTEKWGYIDKTGNRMTTYPFTFSYYGPFMFRSGLEPIQKNGKWGYVTITGKTTIDFQFDEAFGFSEGLAAVKKEGQWSFIDKTGNTVIGLPYSQVRHYSEGLAAVEEKGKWGYINKSGSTVIDLQFDEAYPFTEGLAAVQKNGKYGYIDQAGKTIIGFQFEKAERFTQNRAEVARADTTFQIDRAGHKLERSLR